MAATKVGHGLAKVLGIKIHERDVQTEDILRGESVFSTQTADTYVEQEPTSAEWVRDTIPSVHDFRAYVWSLFPFIHWIPMYNLQWLIGDLIAGITIGAVVVPQGMAYAKLASLPVEYGLYTSFMGVMVYWFFATSKDITIGPVAVLSTLVGKVVTQAAKINKEIPGHVIASALSVIVGAIILFIGLMRWGRIVDFIPLVSIAAFMTGSAINIAVGQFPGLMGITGYKVAGKLVTFDPRGVTYRVFINTLKGLPTSSLDAAIGLTALFMLYLIRGACNFGAYKFPSRKKTFFFISTLRTAFTILLYTMISWLVNRHHRKKPLFKTLGDVPRGFETTGAPLITTKIIKIFASEIPVTVIVALIEHIAISKSFGRVNNYVINPSQELVAIGITNIFGPFVGAYPATASFSRTAIKSKAGVRTPFAGVITGVIVLLAIFALKAVFFYIPNAGLSAVIIHAVLDLVTPPNTVYQFWRVSPLEVPIFFAGVLVTVFSSIENGIYVTICASAALLLLRVLLAKGRFLGSVRIHSLSGEDILNSESRPLALVDNGTFGKTDGLYADAPIRHAFLPVDHGDGSNPDIEVSTPIPGIFIFRFSEGFNYPNASYYLDQLTDTIFATTRRTNLDHYARPGDRPWNDPGTRKGKATNDHPERPTLKAIILDFSSVNNVDVTSVQTLIDVRNQLDRYVAPSAVDWHFTNINNRWTKRALVSAGFGYPTTSSSGGVHRWKPIFSVAEIGGRDSAAEVAEITQNEKEIREQNQERHGIAGADSASSASSSDLKRRDVKNGGVGGGKSVAIVSGLNRPLFHVDLVSAVQSAVANVREREEFERRGGHGIGEIP